MGTSFVEYRGSGFWTRDAALETVLGLLVAELQPLCHGEDSLSSVLDHWTMQATAGFTGCVSADLDSNLADPGLRSHATAARLVRATWRSARLRPTARRQLGRAVPAGRG